MHPVFLLGGLEIYAYALFTWLGAGSACILAMPGLKRAGMSAMQRWGVLILMCICFLVGARLWNVAVNPVNEKLREYEITREQLLAPDGMPPAVPMDEFRGEQFILLRPANDTRERAEAVLKANGLKPSVLFELDQQMTAFHVTCSGAGISFVSDTLILASAQMGDVCFYRLPEKYSRRMIRFFWKKGRYVSRIMREFLAICDQS